jgi:hypothetical protein
MTTGHRYILRVAILVGVCSFGPSAVSNVMAEPVAGAIRQSRVTGDTVEGSTGAANSPAWLRWMSSNAKSARGPFFNFR